MLIFSTMYFDKSGKLIDHSTWVKLFEDKVYCRIAFTRIKETTVSTVWVGLYDNICETLVEKNSHIIRHKNADEALKYHNNLLKNIKKYNVAKAVEVT